MRVLLLRPPRYVWPFNSETSAFWPPLALLCLAGAVRRALPDVDIEVWDAPGEKCGWRTLERKLAAQRIDVLGVGEETVSAHEALRAAEMVKRFHPHCVVVAGGMYFAHAIQETLDGGHVDVVVRSEGEDTFVELLHHLQDRHRWESIKGLAFLDADGGLVKTPPRPLICDLDTLPLPAYDLIDLNRYGRRSSNHPGLVSIEHSRGCIDSCSFCILWKHMGEPLNGDDLVRSRLRTKSAERSFDEVQQLYHEYGRRTFGWVDPTFNASPEWSDAWAERMLRSNLVPPNGDPRTLHTAWVRADCVVRDERLGILEKLVRAGLRQVMIGVERADCESLSAVGKHNNDPEICREAFAIFRERFPQVYTIGTIIYGLPGDTAADLKRLAACQDDMGMDYCFEMPLTPNPGTAVASEARQHGRIVHDDLRNYNFQTPVCRTDSLSLRGMQRTYWWAEVKPSWRRYLRMIRKVFLEKNLRKRRVHRSMFRHGTRILFKTFLRAILLPRDDRPIEYWRRPSWYDK